MIFDILLWVYILTPFFGLWFVFGKAGIPRWKALVPIYNFVVWIKDLLGKSWKWYIYMLIPAINIFTYLLLVVETAKTFRRYGLLEQTLAVIFPSIYLPYLGLSPKMVYTHPKDLPSHKLSSAREWLDAFIFALVAATIIRTFVFELYNIPSSSMEKSLMVGDFLYVSKTSYGPRFPMTPLAVPLVHHSLPFTNSQVKSFSDLIQLPYHRYGKCNVERFDATVFNFPDGDTVSLYFQSNRSYHSLVREYGREYVNSPQQPFGKIITRPVDKRENFIKRTIGLPGETLEIKHRMVYINGKQIDTPSELQFRHIIEMKPGAAPLTAEELMNIGVSEEDASTMQFMGDLQCTYLTLSKIQLDKLTKSGFIAGWEPLRTEDITAPSLDELGDSAEFLVRIYVYYTQWNEITKGLNSLGIDEEAANQARYSYYTLPLTSEKVEKLKARTGVLRVIPSETFPGYREFEIFPYMESKNWNVDNFGPVWIPKAGATIQLTADNLPIYRRAIEVFEGNKLEVKNGKIFINDQETTSYTFKMNYYWMMGDNRHNSADSRYWGFVPEDHIVGKAVRIIFSWDKDQKSFFKKIRWNRMFRKASCM
ncbi:MAG: signal peptidase I [Bacteroidales bacterium]|nr:signal peptidase I [Bacteroidales bacterium]